MALPNVTAFLAATNTCVRPQADVQFDCLVQNNTSQQLVLTNVQVDISPAGACAFRSYPMLPPFQAVIGANGSFHYGFTERFTASADAQQGHFQYQVCCTFYDAAGDVAVSNVVQVAVYPLLPTLLVQVLAPASSLPAIVGGSLPTQPPPVPSGIGFPVLPVLGQVWLEDERTSGAVAYALGVI